MNARQQVSNAAEKILRICQKARPTKSDRDRLFKLHREIFDAIEGLVECDICGSIPDFIATLKIGKVEANMCKACGIKALEAEAIKKSRRSSKAKSRASGRKRTPSRRSQS